MKNTYYGDFHTHTRYSDGLGTVEENVKCAIDAGLKAVAITDHGFNNPKPFSLRYDKFLMQRAEIKEVRLKYPQIEVLHGIEADIIGMDGTIDMTLEQCSEVDLLIGGFHRWAKAKTCKDFRQLYANLNTYLPNYYKTPSLKKLVQNTDAFIAMVENYPIDILAHLNSCVVTDSVEVAKACARNNVLMELNMKHFDLIEKDFDKLLETGVNFIASSDSHKPSRIGKFDTIDKFLFERGADKTRIVNIDSRPKFRRDFDKYN